VAPLGNVQSSVSIIWILCLDINLYRKRCIAMDLTSFSDLCMLKVDAFPMTVMFGMCSVFLFVASILQRRLMNVAEIHKSSKSSDITHKML